MSREHALLITLIPLAHLLGPIPVGLLGGLSKGVDPRTAGFSLCAGIAQTGSPMDQSVNRVMMPASAWPRRSPMTQYRYLGSKVRRHKCRCSTH